MHQGVFGNGLHRRSEKVRRADADSAWRRRPDRADRSVGDAVVEASEGRDTKSDSGSTARDVLDAEGSSEPGVADVFPESWTRGGVKESQQSTVESRKLRRIGMDGRENICGPGKLGRSVLRPY